MRPWIQAWRSAMPTFYQRAQPSDHFRTGAHHDGSVPRALAEVVRQCAAALDSESVAALPIDVVDVGGGDGSLLETLMAELQRVDPDLALRCRPVVVELRPRPTGFADGIAWIHGTAPDAVPPHLHGVLIAHELLDDVPLEVLQCDDDGQLRVVLVDEATGQEALGEAATTDSITWCHEWWHPTSPGDRIEVGLTRDEMWMALTSHVDRGVAVAIDYAHTRAERAAGEHRLGTLAGYRRGRAAPPAPDGGMNVTAHVALDACADAAGRMARAEGRACTTAFMSQRDAITSLLPVAPALAPEASAHERLSAIGRASHRSEAIEPAGLGSFTWLVQSFGVAPPASIR